MADNVKYSLKDYDGERSGTIVNIPDVTAANIDALSTQAATLRTTMEALMLQGWYSADMSESLYNTNPSVTDQYSQRESKWVIIVEDNLGNVYKANEIPCAKLAILENGNKYIYKNKAVAIATAAADVTAFVAAYEALARSPSGGVVTVVDIFQAGRNI